MNKGIAYKLNKLDLKIATYIGTARDRNSKKMGMPDTTHSDKDTLEGDIEGAAGELAFCAIQNINLPTEVTEGTDAPFGDCKLDGKVIDVKHTNYNTGHLLVRPKQYKQKPVDFYALVTGEIPFLTYRGWMTYEDVGKQPLQDPDNKGPCYYIHQGLLEPADRALFMF